MAAVIEELLQDDAAFLAHLESLDPDAREHVIYMLGIYINYMNDFVMNLAEEKLQLAIRQQLQENLQVPASAAAAAEPAASAAATEPAASAAAATPAVAQSLTPLLHIQILEDLSAKLDRKITLTEVEHQNSPILQELLENAQTLYLNQIAQDKDYIKKRTQELYQTAIQDIAKHSRYLLENANPAKPPLGIIPTLRFAIENATQKASQFEAQLVEIGILPQAIAAVAQKITTVASELQALDALQVQSKAELEHYIILLKQIQRNLEVKLGQAQDLFARTKVNLMLQTNLAVRLRQAEQELQNIATLKITSPDIEATYRNLLTEYIAQLRGSIVAAATRFAGFEAQITAQHNYPTKLQMLQVAIANIAQLNIADPIEAQHYVYLVTELHDLIERAIDEANQKLHSNPFYKMAGKDRLAGVQQALAALDTVQFAVSPAKEHYLSLLRIECNRLEASFGMALTVFTDLAKIVSVVDRLQEARRRLATARRTVSSAAAPAAAPAPM